MLRRWWWLLAVLLLYFLTANGYTLNYCFFHKSPGFLGQSPIGSLSRQMFVSYRDTAQILTYAGIAEMIILMVLTCGLAKIFTKLPEDIIVSTSSAAQYQAGVSAIRRYAGSFIMIVFILPQILVFSVYCWAFTESTYLDLTTAIPTWVMFGWLAIEALIWSVIRTRRYNLIASLFITLVVLACPFVLGLAAYAFEANQGRLFVASESYHVTYADLFVMFGVLAVAAMLYRWNQALPKGFTGWHPITNKPVV